MNRPPLVLGTLPNLLPEPLAKPLPKLLPAPLPALVLTLLLTVTGAVFAQEATVVDLDTVLALAPEVDGSVLDARTALLTAERDLTRTRADPQAVRLDVEAGVRQVAQARDDLEVALAGARVTAVTAYGELLSAQELVDQARLEREIAATTLAATTARHEAGAATDLEVAEAENDLAAAERNERDTATDLQFAMDTLVGIVGTEIRTVVPIADEALPESIDEGTVLSEAEAGNTRLHAAERAVDAARAQLAAVDNAFSARSEVEAAQQTLADAETTLADMRDDLPLTLRRAMAAVTSAESRYRSATAALTSSAESLAAQAARLEAGSISPLAYSESELSHLTAEASLASARRALLLAHLELDAAILQ